MKILPNDFIYDIMIKCDNKTLMNWRLVSKEHNKMVIHILALRGITYDKLHERYMGHPLEIDTSIYEDRFIKFLNTTINKVNQIITRNIKYEDWNICAEFAKQCIISLMKLKLTTLSYYPVNDAFLLLSIINIPIKWLRLITIFIKYPTQFKTYLTQSTTYPNQFLAFKGNKCFHKYYNFLIRLLEKLYVKIYTPIVFSDFKDNGIITQQEQDVIERDSKEFITTTLYFEKELKIEICDDGCIIQRTYSTERFIF